MTYGLIIVLFALLSVAFQFIDLNVCDKSKLNSIPEHNRNRYYQQHFKCHIIKPI